MEFLNAAALRRSALYVALVVWTAGCGGGANTITQDGPAVDEPRLPSLAITGPYTFRMEVDPACGWPLSTFAWPVFAEVGSYVQGTTIGSIVFPPTPGVPSNKWSIYASPTRTQLIPVQGSPGQTAVACDVVVDGGRWEAGGPTRAPYNRGEITSGTATGARQIFILRTSGQRWECRSDAKWSLLVRYVD